MFNLNENNRIVMSQHPADMRMGIATVKLCWSMGGLFRLG